MRVATIFTLYFEICTLTIVIFGYLGLYLSQTKQETKTMAQKTITSSAFGDSKPHYELLDGLRGVAALLVIWYHVWEGFAFVGGGMIENFNHGYLAVDFFFMLSGFVITYADDDRWG